MCSKAFKPKLDKKRQRRSLCMIKGTIQQEIIIVNIYATNVSAPNYIKETL
jgi:hypothetical protein